MWEARAEYADGTEVDELFDYNDRKNEDEQQYDLECWLIERHEGCIWYSIAYVDEDIVDEDI